MIDQPRRFVKPSGVAAKAVRILALALTSWSGLAGGGCPNDKPPTASPPPPALPPPPTLTAPDTAVPLADPVVTATLPAGVHVFRRDVVALAASGDARFLAGGDLGGRALLWDVARNVFAWSDQTTGRDRIRPVVFAPEGTRWLAGAFDRPTPTWRLFDAERQTTVASWGDDRGTAVDAAFDRTGQRVVTASVDPDRVVVMALGDTPATLFERAARAVAVAIDDTGETVAWSGAREVVAVTLADKSDLLKVATEGATTRLLFDGDALVGARDAMIVRWPLPDAAARSEVPLADNSRPIRELRRLPRGLTAVTRSDTDGLVLWDAGGQPVAAIRFGCPCELHALSANGCLAACGCVERAEVRWRRLSGPAFAGCAP